MVDSCQHCKSRVESLQQYCEREDFVLKVPAGLDPAGAAPIACAGVTTYSPLKHWKVGTGTEVGIVGFGGLGQMALKLAKAMGANVTMISRSEAKKADAFRLGATHFVLSTEDKEMKANASRLDFILSTIPQPHDPNPYMTLLRREGVYTVVGCLAPLKAPLDMSKMVTDRKSLGSTLIGSIAETQEVFDFCGKHGIVSEIKLITVDEINEAFADVDKGKVDYRYVISMATIKGKKPDDSLLAKVGL